MDTADDTFNYAHSCGFENWASVKICTLEGKRKKPTNKDILNDPLLEYLGINKPNSDLYVECKMYHGKKYFPLPIRTRYKAFSTRWNWNEWLELPVKYSFLDRNAVLCFTIYDYGGIGKVIPVGGTTITFYRKNGLLRKGIYDLKVWADVEADPFNTPGIDNMKHEGDNFGFSCGMYEVFKQYKEGKINSVEWLDRLSFREVEIMNDQRKRSSKFMYLTIEFPKIYAKDGTIMDIVYWIDGIEEIADDYKRYKLYDPESSLENLSETKHYYLTRSARSGITDKDRKPNAQYRDILFKIMDYPPTKALSSEELDIVWQYRFFLSSHKKGLIKFLKCVKWDIDTQAKQAIDLLSKWAAPDANDALELLGPAFSCPEVRHYAVERLSHATDDDLLLYLLQLVQALRYEPVDVNSMNLLDVSHYSLESESSIDGKIVHLALEDAASHTSKDDKTYLSKTGAIPKVKCSSNDGNIQPKEILQQETDVSLITKGIDDCSVTAATAEVDSGSLASSKSQPVLLLEQIHEKSDPGLASFLIKRACENPILANYLYWYLFVECEQRSTEELTKPEARIKEIYLFIMHSFKISLQQGSPKARATWHTLTRQHLFLDNLVSILKTVSKESGGRPKKIEKLQSLIRSEDPMGTKSANFEPLPLPLDPEVSIVGLVADNATIFKSALEPSRLTFTTSSGSEYVTIFKLGDDLRQDQLIIQVIILMDRLLQNENMDLKLTPYRVLATSPRDGFVQYIKSVSVAEVLHTNGTILNFLRMGGNDEPSTAGVPKEVMDNYIKSLAGYCVITYLLGIGDRHYDNLLITEEGNLFHIDFGYILGRDPKPLPPAMKLTKELVDGMGGMSSPNYTEFRKLCYTAFHQLRRHANLILNLFSLMVDASIPDIALEPDKMVKKIEDRFCLSLSDEDAVAFMQELIDSSLSAVMATFVEQVHKLAQMARK